MSGRVAVCVGWGEWQAGLTWRANLLCRAPHTRAVLSLSPPPPPPALARSRVQRPLSTDTFPTNSFHRGRGPTRAWSEAESRGDLVTLGVYEAPDASPTRRWVVGRYLDM